jgi:hypothetical protein
MKRTVVLLGFAILAAVGCHRKTVPSVPSGNKAIPPVASPEQPIPSPGATPSLPANPAAPPVILGSPMIIVDGSGNIVTPKDKLPPDVAAKVHYASLARSFTPAQKKNLVYRYKMIPPKVLYVPEGYVLKSARGKYIVYRKKFWYWQKADGLFHLDPTYYQ